MESVRLRLTHPSGLACVAARDTLTHVSLFTLRSAMGAPLYIRDVLTFGIGDQLGL